MFGTVLDSLDKYFGRPFLLSRCFPWLLYLAVNLAVASIEFPAVRTFFAAEYTGATTAKAFDLVAALIAVAVVAYVTSPIIQAMTDFLEGGWIGGFLARFLVPFEMARRERLEARYRAILARRGKLRGAKDAEERLKSDRAIGQRLRRILDVTAISEAERALDALMQRRWMNMEIDRETLDAFVLKLSRALRLNCAEVRSLDPDADVIQARRLSLIYKQAIDLVPYTFDILEQLEFRARLAKGQNFAKLEIAPTRLGNSAAALREYCDSRYGIAFEAFWPRFLLVVAVKDQKLADAIAAQKVQLDFSILCFTLTVVSLAGWAFVLLFWGRSLWTAAAVLIGGPALAWAWLRIVQSSYAGFAEVARDAVDLRRFDLLDALHLPLPVRSDDESRIWKTFAELALLNQKTPVTYRSAGK